MESKIKRNLSTFVSVFSIVNAFFIPEWVNFLGEHSKDSIFVTPTPFENAYFAMFLSVLGLGILISLVVFFLEKYKFRKINVFVHLMLLLSMVVILNFAREETGAFYKIPQLSKLINFYFYDFLIRHQVISVIIGLTVTVFTVLKLNGHIVAFTRIVGLVLSPLIVVFYGNLFFYYSKSYVLSSQSRSVSKIQQSANSNFPRVLWLIFDEMDYRLVFDNRPAKLKLPELDRLRNESLFFTHAYPPGDRTMHSIPSLLSGIRWNVVGVEEGDLTLKANSKNSIETHLTEIPNVFGEIKKMGYKTGLLGWYHNYCRIFKNDLDYCRRVPAGRFGYAENFWGSVEAIFSRSLNFNKKMERSYIYNLNEITSNASKRIKSGDYSLLFVHLSIPHAPWIYDSKSKKVSAYASKDPSEYFANIELVDKTVGDFRKALEETGNWDKTTLILSSDHSWRESGNYDGKRDLRIPFFIKMPDHRGEVFNEPTGTILTKEFILKLMTKNISSTEQAKKWFDANNNDFPQGSVMTSTDNSPLKKTEEKNSRLDSPKS